MMLGFLRPRNAVLAVSGILAVLTVSCVEARAGYTHYFTWYQKPTDAAIKEAVSEMNLLIAARKSILVSPDEPGSIPGTPKVESSQVDFNGIGADAHEPFVFPGGIGFNFCKTAAKPYDEVVTACLLVARDHFPPSTLSISSDGSWDDWIEGAKLYSSVLRRSAKNPMTAGSIGGERGFRSRALLTALLLLMAAMLWLARQWRKGL